MKDTSIADDWRSWCELASKETNPRKLLELITKINQAIEECHPRWSQPDKPWLRIDAVLPPVSKNSKYEFYQFPGERSLALEYDCYQIHPEALGPSIILFKAAARSENLPRAAAPPSDRLHDLNCREQD
jgi:hypothetical protein